MTHPRRPQPDTATCKTCQTAYPLGAFTMREDGTRRRDECRACLSRYYQRLHGRRPNKWAARSKPNTTGDLA